MALFFFLVQFATGVLLMLYYRPSADEAFESVEFIMTTVAFGWLIRSIHSWSANLMIFFAFLHLVSVFFLKAYRAPRELTWVSGCLLFFVDAGLRLLGIPASLEPARLLRDEGRDRRRRQRARGGRVAPALPARRRPRQRRDAVALLRLARGDPSGRDHRG